MRDDLVSQSGKGAFSEMSAMPFFNKREVGVEERKCARSVELLASQYRKFFAATILAVVILQVTIITDTIIVGQLLGPVPMSGIRVASPIVNLLGVLSMLIGVGGSTVAAIAMGKGDPAKASRSFSLSIVLCVAVGLVFALIVVPLAPAIASAITSDTAPLEYTTTFLRIVAAGAPFYILASAMAMLLRADGCIKLSSAVLAAAGIANVVFDLLFIGVLGLGVAGSALATDAGMLVAVLMSLLYFRWPKRTLRLVNPLSRKVSGELGSSAGALCAAVLKNGMPGSLRMLFACISLLVLNLVVGDVVGVMGIALMTVCGNIQLLAVAFFSGGGQAAAPMEGVLYGEGDFVGMRLLFRYVMKVTLIAVGILVVIVWLFPEQIISMFYSGGAQIDDADLLLRLYAIGFLPLAVNYILTYYYNTIQQRKVAMTLTLCENLLLYIPLIFLLTNALGLLGAILAFVLGEGLSTAIALLMARSVAAKSGLDGVLLLPRSTPSSLFEATAAATVENASVLARGLKEALEDAGVSSDISLRSSVALEEMLVASATRRAGDGKHDTFDVRVVQDEQARSVKISLRDNGAPFDPTNESEDVGAQEAPDSIAMLRAVATKLEWAFVAGMNRTTIEIAKVTT